MDYIYEDITEQPNIGTNTYNEETEEWELTSGIMYDIPLSDMTDKSIENCTWWNNARNELLIVFTNELSAEDKTILDQIVEDNS